MTRVAAQALRVINVLLFLGLVFYLTTGNFGELLKPETDAFGEPDYQSLFVNALVLLTIFTAACLDSGVCGNAVIGIMELWCSAKLSVVDALYRFLVYGEHWRVQRGAGMSLIPLSFVAAILLIAFAVAYSVAWWQAAQSRKQERLP